MTTPALGATNEQIQIPVRQIAIVTPKRLDRKFKIQEAELMKGNSDGDNITWENSDTVEGEWELLLLKQHA